MLDRDLAELYGVETRALNQAVKRNSERFPADFMFQLKDDEYQSMISQIVMSKRGGTRRLPFAFTELGVSMLSSVLRSKIAIEINIKIMRTFVETRLQLPVNSTVRELENIKKHLAQHDEKFKECFAAIQYLISSLDDKTEIL